MLSSNFLFDLVQINSTKDSLGLVGGQLLEAVHSCVVLLPPEQETGNVVQETWDLKYCAVNMFRKEVYLKCTD